MVNAEQLEKSKGSRLMRVSWDGGDYCIGLDLMDNF